MEEKIKEFIQQELWELVDAVVDFKYCGGKKPEVEIIESKERKLRDLVGDENIQESPPFLNQARFIISNARRELECLKNDE